MGITVYASVDKCEATDAFLITDMKNPKETYDGLVKKYQWIV